MLLPEVGRQNYWKCNKLPQRSLEVQEKCRNTVRFFVVNTLLFQNFFKTYFWDFFPEIIPWLLLELLLRFSQEFFLSFNRVSTRGSTRYFPEFLKWFLSVFFAAFVPLLVVELRQQFLLGYFPEALPWFLLLDVFPIFLLELLMESFFNVLQNTSQSLLESPEMFPRTSPRI